MTPCMTCVPISLVGSLTVRTKLANCSVGRTIVGNAVDDIGHTVHAHVPDTLGDDGEAAPKVRVCTVERVKEVIQRQQV